MNAGFHATAEIHPHEIAAVSRCWKSRSTLRAIPLRVTD
jgi:hypothetical protein